MQDTKKSFFEIEISKKVLKLNLPIQIGYFILQYAKLHILQFYFDFMDRFVNRADFALDTARWTPIPLT